MITKALFIIRPKPELRFATAGSDLEDTPFVEDAVLWTCEIVDRSCWSRQEIENGIKEAFLRQLKSDFLTHNEANSLGLSEALPSNEFDRFWTLESFFSTDQRLEDVLRVTPESKPFQNAFLRARSQAMKKE
jgi:hypothetical protein